MLNTIFTALALLFIVAMLLQIFTIQAFFSRLEKAHKEKYEAMYKPKWRIQLADDAFRDGLKYLRSKQFQELEDPELNKLYKKLKRTDYAAIGFGIIALAIVVFQSVVIS